MLAGSGSQRVNALFSTDFQYNVVSSIIVFFAVSAISHSLSHCTMRGGEGVGSSLQRGHFSDCLPTYSLRRYSLRRSMFYLRDDFSMVNTPQVPKPDHYQNDLCLCR